MTISFNKKRGDEMAMAINFRENPRPLTRTRTKTEKEQKAPRQRNLKRSATWPAPKN